jgi:hypothetical protein
VQTDEPSTRAWSTQTLHVINGPVPGARDRLDRPEMLLGTDAWFSPFGADSGLSRRHAQLRHNSEGALVIQHMGSTTAPASTGHASANPTDVNPGDEIGPGATRPRFTDDTTAAGTSALPPNDSANPAQEIERARQLCAERRYEDAESLCARIAATPPYQLRATLPGNSPDTRSAILPEPRNSLPVAWISVRNCHASHHCSRP